MKYSLYSRPAVIHIVVVMVLLSLFSCAAAAQTGKKSDLYEIVPDSIKSSFARRMSLFIETMRSERYEKAYDLLAKDYTRKQSREDFAREQKTYYSNGDKFIDFVPDVIMSESDGGAEDPTEFSVIGCLVRREKGKQIKLSADLGVYVEAGNIYFSKFEPLRGKDGKYMPCSTD